MRPTEDMLTWFRAIKAKSRKDKWNQISKICEKNPYVKPKDLMSLLPCSECWLGQLATVVQKTRKEGKLAFRQKTRSRKSVQKLKKRKHAAIQKAEARLKKGVADRRRFSWFEPCPLCKEGWVDRMFERKHGQTACCQTNDRTIDLSKLTIHDLFRGKIPFTEREEKVQPSLIDSNAIASDYVKEKRKRKLCKLFFPELHSDFFKIHESKKICEACKKTTFRKAVSWKNWRGSGRHWCRACGIAMCGACTRTREISLYGCKSKHKVCKDCKQDANRSIGKCRSPPRSPGGILVPSLGRIPSHGMQETDSESSLV